MYVAELAQYVGYSARHAAEEYAVPISTLHVRLCGKHLLGGKSGPTMYLTEEEESELAEFLIGCALVRFAKSCSELVQELLRRKGRVITVNHGWWDSRGCHPNITYTLDSLTFCMHDE